MSNIKPWREIARPHADVLDGAFKQSEFAADITQVLNKEAVPEYQDPEKFFSRTYITEGMRLLLISVVQRLSGQGGDPVIQLQTAFGGGKTHALLAVLHLASRTVSTEMLNGIPPVLDEAGIQHLPYAKVAVIDGIKISPSQPRKYKEVSINTIWGELAWQLLGKEGYLMIADSDRDGTSPGKQVFVNLISKAAPCVILIDELVAFIRQLSFGKQYKAGTFDTNLSAIQALTEAVKSVPNSIVLASLPESDLEIGGAMGLNALNTLEKYFARVESVWKPVEAEESFEIVRRRLFETPGEHNEIEIVCRKFCEFYRQHSGKFPVETQSNEYFERLCRSYPIHPEIFDRLYEDWSTLEKFQRTRGVLQYLAIVIHRLWNSDNKDLLISPGSIPLEDSTVRNKSIHYLPLGWEPVIEREVDGPLSAPQRIDSLLPLYGGLQAARRTARTIFLGSATFTREQMVRGINVERVLLGSVQPGQTINIFEDVLKRLRDRLHYLYSNKDRYWFDTKPNLRREMESRKQNINEHEELFPLLKRRTSQQIKGSHNFSGIHVFTPSGDVPDDFSGGPRLVILPPANYYSPSKTNQAFVTTEEFLRNRGEQPRQNQNRLIFLAPDQDAVNQLKEMGRIFLAWQSIISDIENGSLNQDVFYLNQAGQNRDRVDRSLTQMVRETYKWLIVPTEEICGNKPTLNWEVVGVSPSEANLLKTIEQTLCDEEWLIYEWSPIHLRNILSNWYLKNGTEDVSALKVWRDCCNYTYLPRILNDKIFCQTIEKGIESRDYFGFAAGKEGDRYLGFRFGQAAFITLDDSSLLIDREVALRYHDSEEQILKPIIQAETELEGEEHTEITSDLADIETTNQPAKKKRFYGTVSINPVKAKLEFIKLADEVIQQFTENFQVDVEIELEINANSSEGFDESLQRAINENCNVLGFSSVEFEDK